MRVPRPLVLILPYIASVACGGEPLVFRFKCQERASSIVPVLETVDGTTALGGAKLLRVDPEGALALAAFGQAVAPSVVKLVDGTLLGDFGANGSVRVSAPYLVRPGCPQVDEEARDGGAADAADAHEASTDAGDDAGDGAP